MMVALSFFCWFSCRQPISAATVPRTVTGTSINSTVIPFLIELKVDSPGLSVNVKVRFGI